MPERREFLVTQEEFDEILEACKPTPLMYLPGGQPMGPSPQENANAAWCSLGRKRGFDGMTVRPTGSQLCITAEPVEAKDGR